MSMNRLNMIQEVTCHKSEVQQILNMQTITVLNFRIQLQDYHCQRMIIVQEV